MAHLIERTQNRNGDMAYAGELPWHGLGTRLDETADLETWKAAAGFNWKVLESPVYYDLGADPLETDLRQLGTHKVLRRSDTNKPLGLVGVGYRVVQPAQIAEFFADAIRDSGFQMHTMGMLKGGGVFWALARVPDGFSLPGGDAVEPYALIATSADGTLATVAHFTPIRVVCANTLFWAVGADGKFARVRQTHKTDFDPRRIQAQLGLVPELWRSFQERAALLAARKVNRQEAVRFFVDVLYPGLEAFDPANRLAAVQLAAVFADGVGQDLETARGTAWGLLNAVTRYADFEARSRDQDTRLQSAWFGARAAQKSRAVEHALALL